MKRVDKLLFEQKIFDSRKKAQVAIEKGLVFLKRGPQITKIEKPSSEIQWQEGDQWQIESHPEFRYVSRSGAKLQGALDHWRICVDQWSALDVGQSTGGFSECLLNNGARCVVGVDVGQGQLHERLRSHPQLLSLEKLNAKLPLPTEVLELIETFTGARHFDMLVFDVSFISVLPVIESQWNLLRAGGVALVLLKPQFEVGRGHHDKKGFVDDEEGLRVLEKTVTTLMSLGMSIEGTCPSVLRGEDGNQEYFIFIKK